MHTNIINLQSPSQHPPRVKHCCVCYRPLWRYTLVSSSSLRWSFLTIHPFILPFALANYAGKCIIVVQMLVWHFAQALATSCKTLISDAMLFDRFCLHDLCSRLFIASGQYGIAKSVSHISYFGPLMCCTLVASCCFLVVSLWLRCGAIMIPVLSTVTAA